MNVSWTTMADWCRGLFVASGLDDAAASCVSDNLLYAERRGFTSHGFMRTGTYVSRILGGGINRRPNVTVIAQRPALAIVDSDGAAGAYSASRCVDVVLGMARESGAGVVVARNANHFGAAGFYTDVMASAGFFGIALCNTDAVMCAPFGGRPVLGTNPISMAVPTSSGVGPQLDMATSEGNYGKILFARDHGEQIPAGWAVDVDGAGTTDPLAGLEGALLPSGGPKGFGLAFMVDALAAIGGAATSNEVSAMYGDPRAPQGLGHVFIAIEVDRGQTRAEYSARIEGLRAAVHASATPGSTRAPMVPGEPEQQRLHAATRWAADPTTVQQLAALSAELGVAVPDEVEGQLLEHGSQGAS